MNIIDKTFAAFPTLTDLLNSKTEFQNPSEQSFATITSFISSVTAIILYIAGIIAVIMIVYGGILYMTALGQEAKLETAKKTLIWSIVGFVLIILAQAIIDAIMRNLQK